MSSAPTRGAVDTVNQGWVERPYVARALRLALFVLPIVMGWLAVRSTKDFYWQPVGSIGIAFWIIQAIIVATAASYAVNHVTKRLTPLSALFRLTLVFPDHAPSRLGVALRGGTVRKLEASTDLSGQTAQQAAEQALGLVAQLGRHERLTRGHTERVRARAELIGAEMGLSGNDLQMLRWGVLLHDVGKLRVPAEILNKESKLTEEEWEILSQHPAYGAEMVAPLEGWLGEWAKAAGEHHERWDGAGYPAGLSSTDISLAGRITAVADAYDVITSKRSYKKAMSDEAARQELLRCSGQQFDPEVVRAALSVGLREPNRAGFLGWLFELPRVIQVASVVPPAAATAAAAVAISVAGVPEVQSDISQDIPAAIALAEEEATEEPAPATTTTTTAASTTTTTIATTSTAAPSTSTQTPTTTTIATTTTPAPTTSTTATTTTTTATTTTQTPTTTTVAAPSLPTGAQANVIAGAGAPNDLGINSIVSGTTVSVIEEQQRFTLTAGLPVTDLPQGETWQANNTPKSTIPAGTVVCSWLVRYDLPEDATSDGQIETDINFHSEILGLALGSGEMQATSMLEVDGVPGYSNFGVEVWDEATVNGETLSLYLRTVANGYVQLRVITAC